MRQPDKTIVFETKAEFDAFMRGFLWERDEYEADIVTTNFGGKWQAKMSRIYEEDYQLGGRYAEGEAVSGLANVLSGAGTRRTK
jgi:hypothetical protein